MNHPYTSSFLLAALLLTAPLAQAESGPAPFWNGDQNYPAVYSELSTAWYMDSKSAKISANDASSLVFSVDLLLVDTVKDPNAYEFRRYWFRKPQSDNPYLVYMRHGDAGEWTALVLNDPSPETARSRQIFLAGWQAATGFSYGLPAPEVQP